MRRWWVASLSLTFVAACSPGDGGGSDPATARRCGPGATLRLAYNDNTVIEDQGKIMGSRIDGERRRVVRADNYAYAPDFSPDGSKLVFTTARNGETGSSAGFSRQDLYVIDSTGKNERPLTEGHLDEDPAWSPDGRWIMFVRGYSSKKGGIYKVRPDGSQLHEVVPRPEPLRPHTPVWSLDGRKIAWAQWNIEDEGPTQVWTASAEGSGLRMVAELDQIYTISWSPDGETLAASPGRAGAVYLIDIDSGNAEILVEGASGAEWSADGSHLYYWRKIGDPGNETHVLERRDMRTGERQSVEGTGHPWFLYRGFDVEPLPCALR